MQKYLIIRVLFLISAIRSIRSIDFLNYEGEINVLQIFGLTRRNEPTNFIRLQKSYVIQGPNRFDEESELKSFAFESIFRIDEKITRTKKTEFILFSLPNTEKN